MKLLVLYMPVLHRGYLDLFDAVRPSSVVLLSEDILRGLPNGFEYILKKDSIRAVDSEVMHSVLIHVLRKNGIAAWLGDHRTLEVIRGNSIFMPDEDVSRAVAKQYFDGGEVTFISGPKLRYHRGNVEEKNLVTPNRRIPISEVDREMMVLATRASERSPDWWRQVGGVLLTQDGTEIIGYNEHQPHEQIAATLGDPRSIFKSGVRTDISFGDHAEHVVIGESARRGIVTDGATMYITTFPCLHCGRLLVRSGVKRLFYRDPSYGLLDADADMRREGIELIEVDSASVPKQP